MAVRQYLTRACTEFVSSGLAESKFVTELVGGSDQKFWARVSEALVADRLRGKHFGARAMSGEGPDFLVMDGDRRVWVEVVCPEPTNVPSEWLDPLHGVAVSFPYEAILLRWTSAIKIKAEMLIGSADGTRKGYLGSGLVAPDDAYVIAVNGCRLRRGVFSALFGISQLPFAAEAVFPIGPFQLSVDRETMEVIDRGHHHRPFVLNQNRAEFPVRAFLDPRYRAVSAVWALDLNGGSAIGNSEPCAVVHNPHAANQVSRGFFPADHEYVAVVKEGELILIEVAPSNASAE